MSKKSVHFTGDNLETVISIAKQERRTFNKMVNVLIEDATSGELIKRSSILEFLKANPKAKSSDVIEYFKLYVGR